jgi:hypothetical protein
MSSQSFFRSAVLLGLGTILSLGYGLAQNRSTQSASRNRAKILYSENFNSDKNGVLPSGWWVEGGQSVYVENGRLLVNADPKAGNGPGHVATVWLKKEFSGNIQIDFDAHVVSSSSDVNNINFFLYFTHPGNETLYGTRNLRSNGSYRSYFDLNGYIFTYLKDDPKKDVARFRLRRCPGFELMTEKFAYHNRQGETYHLTITKRGKKLTFAVDGKVYLRATDDKYNWSKGYIVFRTYQTDLWFDNVQVKRLH